MTDLFKPTNSTETTEEIKSYKELLVGDGKKFKDEESLARGKYEADQYVNRLENELAEARTELKSRMTLEEFWEKSRSLQKNSVEPVTQTPDETQHQNNAPTKEEIAELVRKSLTEESSKSQRIANVQYVKDELTKVLGPNFQSKLRARAEELNTSTEFLSSMAETQPKAFITLMTAGVNTKREDPNQYVPPRGSVNSPVTHSGGQRNFQFYEKLRKENPSLYWTPKLQQEIYQTAKVMGEAFYKS